MLLLDQSSFIHQIGTWMCQVHQQVQGIQQQCHERTLGGRVSCRSLWLCICCFIWLCQHSGAALRSFVAVFRLLSGRGA